jgi:CheY-specific phosphatase CheX
MNRKYSGALADVFQQTVLVMCKLDARVVDCRLERNTEAPFEVSGIIGLTGAARGSIVISMPGDVARKMTSRMLNEKEPDCSDQDVSDCVGELTNIIAGNLLALIDQGRDTQEARISLPSIVHGPHRVVWSRRDIPCELVLFETEVGKMAAEVNLRQSVACTVDEEDHVEDLTC